ncbi:hypothetical protein Tco_0360856, partial [Tanacetum coccineum]
MSWNEHFQVNLDENKIYSEHDYVFNEESIFEIDTVFSSREELLDWVRKTRYFFDYVVVIKTSKSNESVTLQCDRSGKSVSKKKSTKNNEEAYAHNLEQLTKTTVDSSGVTTYLYKHWLTRHKELFVVARTKEHLHFGNHTTRRVESQHAKLKLYLDSSQSDLQRIVSYIYEVVNSQVTGIKASIQESRMVMQHRYDIPHFQNLNRFISLYALDIIFHEFQKCGDVEIYENCRCQLRTSYGLPCAHEQAVYLYNGQPLLLDVVDAFWKKLDFSPCISLGVNQDCEAELEELNAEFNKQFGLPSTTLVRDPPAKKTTRRRPSRKKTHVEPPKPSNSSLPKQARHAYINQFPRMFHGFIDRVQDVKADGNCRFRATAVGLDLHEDEWPTIRYRLLQELGMHSQQYVSMFGVDGYNHVRERLNFFNIDECAPIIKWM